MKKNIFICIAFTAAIIISCNKKKSPEPDTPSGNQNSTNQSGFFELLKAQYFDGTNYVTLGEDINLTFVNFDTGPGSAIEVQAGNVTFNGTGLKFGGYSYTDTTYLINYSVPNYTLNVSGSSQIDAFSTTFSPSYPSFTGDSLLPTTVSKSAGFSVNLGSSISNATDTCTIHLLGSTVKKIAPGQTSVTFTPADLSGIMVANGYYYELYLYHNQALIVNNKTYYVRSELQYTKYNINVVP
jgi:hypothetical protein